MINDLLTAGRNALPVGIKYNTRFNDEQRNVDQFSTRKTHSILPIANTNGDVDGYD